MSSTRLVIGIDGGGTSTAAWLADETGHILGKGEAGASNIKAVGLEPGLAALDASIASAFAQAKLPPREVDLACLGLAGFDRPEDIAILERWNRDRSAAYRLHVVNDGDLVIAAGTPEGWGIGLIAGTGSIAVGIGPNHRKTRAGGWGPLFGDEGSAYFVALAALRLTAHRADGRAQIEPRPRRQNKPAGAWARPDLSQTTARQNEPTAPRQVVQNEPTAPRQVVQNEPTAPRQVVQNDTPTARVVPTPARPRSTKRTRHPHGCLGSSRPQPDHRSTKRTRRPPHPAPARRPRSRRPAQPDHRRLRSPA